MQRPVKEFPRFLDDTYCGIYMIDTNGTSDEACTMNQSSPVSASSIVNVKIGYSSTMKTRLDQYLLGSPVCLRVYGLIVVKKTKHKKTPRMMRDCEIYAHDLLRCHHLIQAIDRRHSHTLEWFQCSIRRLCDTFVRCMMYTSMRHKDTNALNMPYFMFSTRPHAYMYKDTPHKRYCKNPKTTPSKMLNDATTASINKNIKVRRIVEELMMTTGADADEDR